MGYERPERTEAMTGLAEAGMTSLKRVNDALEHKFWLDQRVNEVFEAYCRVFDDRQHYAVIQYNVLDDLHVVEEAPWGREHRVYHIPIIYLDLDEPFRTTRMHTDKAEIERKKFEAVQEGKMKELAAIEGKAARLRRELGLPTRVWADDFNQFEHRGSGCCG